MSLSSLGRMLKSYFSRQQRRSRSSLFNTSTSFCRSCTRNRRSPILDPLKTLPRKGKKKDFYRKGNGSWFTFGAGEECLPYGRVLFN